MGVEEELLVVDTDEGRSLSVAQQVVSRVLHPDRPEGPGPADRIDILAGGLFSGEMQQQQVETGTPPRSDLTMLEEDLRRWRRAAATGAREVGARIIASGTSPAPVTPRVVHESRYERIVDRFGLTAAEHLTCGCHVHVSVVDDEEAVAVLDRIRIWLPSVLALSANSPFWQGKDSGYASYRSQVMARWPTVGPTELFGSAAAYRELVSDMVGSGVLLDVAMVAFDARVSARYPTVEIRVADVCLDVRDAVLVAGVCRALVDTAAEEWRAGEPPPAVSLTILRLGSWQAGRDGIDGVLLDPLTARPRPAEEVLGALADHVRPALQRSGDLALVEDRMRAVLSRGNGARRQRLVRERTSRMGDVVADLARVTAGYER